MFRVSLRGMWDADARFQGPPTKPLIKKQRRLLSWLLSAPVVMASVLFAWARDNPSAPLAALVLSKAPALAGLKTWALSFLPKLHQT